LGWGVGGWGFGVWPQTPNPQSPIPKNCYQSLLLLIKIKKI